MGPSLWKPPAKFKNPPPPHPLVRPRVNLLFIIRLQTSITLWRVSATTDPELLKWLRIKLQNHLFKYSLYQNNKVLCILVNTNNSEFNYHLNIIKEEPLR